MTETNIQKTQSKNQSPSKKRAPSFTFFLLLLTWVFLAAVVGYFYTVSQGKPLSLLKQVAESGDVTIDIAAMNERIRTLEHQVEMLESHIYSAKTSFEPTATHDSASSEDENPSITTPQAAETTPASQIDDRIQQLENDLSKAQETTQNVQAIQQHQHLMVTAYELQEAVMAFAPYTQALYEFRLAAPDDETVQFSTEILSTNAEKGIASPETLKQTFHNSLDAAITSLRKEKQDPSLLDTVASKFPSLISIRKTAENIDTNLIEDHDTESLLAKAEYYVEMEAFSDAKELLEGVDNATINQYFSTWLEQATAYENALINTNALIEFSRQYSSKEIRSVE